MISIVFGENTDLRFKTVYIENLSMGSSIINFKGGVLEVSKQTKQSNITGY